MITKYALPLALAAGLFAAASPVVAAPASPVGGLATPATQIETVRYGRRYRARRYRGYGYGRRSAPSNAGNARNPNLPPSQQNQGQTSGGPRY